MNEMPEKIKQQIDDLFLGIEYIGDEDTLFFHKNGEPIFANFENYMGFIDVAFFRNMTSPIFYFMEGSPTTKEYIKGKIKDILVDTGMDEDEYFVLYNFGIELDKIYKEKFYNLLEDEKF